MSKIKVMAGDIKEADWNYSRSSKQMNYMFKFINLKKSLVKVEVITEENQKKLLGTAGWGVAGLALLGPLGAIGGMLIGGRKKQVAFMATLQDGKSFMGVTDSKTYLDLVAFAAKNTL